MEVTTTDLKVYNMDDDHRTLYDAGIIDTDGMVTTEGWKILQTVMLEANKKALVKLVKNINASRETVDE